MISSVADGAAVDAALRRDLSTISFSTSGSGVGVRGPSRSGRSPAPVFWPQRPRLAQRVGDHARVLPCALRLRQPMSRPARSRHLERSHRQAEIGERLVDLPGRGAFQQQRARLALRAAPACGCRRSRGRRRRPRGTLPIVLASSIAVASTSGAVSLAAHDLQQPHDVAPARRSAGRARRCGRLVDGGDLVDVEVGGVGGEDRAGLGDARRAGRNTSFLTAMSSNTASMTRSQSARSAKSVRAA